MSRTDELDEMKTRYKALLQRGEAEPIGADVAFIPPGTMRINSAALAVLVVGARLAKILVDIAIIMSVSVREQRWLRMITQGEVEKTIAEQQAHKPVIYVPGRA